MQKPAILTPQRINRFVVALLLALGVLLPLLMLFEVSGHLLSSLVWMIVVLILLSVLSFPAYKWISLTLCILLASVQFVLPGMGFWGSSLQALKAITLFVNGMDIAMPLVGEHVALFLAVTVAAFCYLFSHKGVGFLPAALMIVLVLFALWALGKSTLVWYTLPALVALLVLISQTSHQKISLPNVLPMAFVVALLSLLLLPSGRLTIAPLEEAAFNLRQKITDYLFFTEPRNVFTLGNYGYYPMGGGQLGGEAEPTEYPVLIVKTNRKTLLRAVTKDEYTGRSFRDTSSSKRYLYVNPRWAALRETIFLEKLPPTALRTTNPQLTDHQIIIEQQNASASTLFSPVFLRNIQTQSNMVPYFNDASELFITRDTQKGDRYTLTAPVFEGGDAGLDTLVNAALKRDSEYETIRAQYTQLPAHIEQLVYDDVSNIVASASTPYDKALTLMRHLHRYYRYTLSPQPPPENQDFVTYFLYAGREGYCTYYAAAMTVMCRMAGLPARYVEGFMATPAEDGLAYVTGKEAHAWTEVYFEGFGWVPFDPTPSQQDNSTTPEQQTQSPQEPDEPEDTNDDPPPEVPPDEDENKANQPEEPPPEQEDPQPDATEEDPTGSVTPSWWILLLLLIATCGMWLLIYLRAPNRIAAKQKTEQDKIFIYGGAVYTLLRLRGCQPKPGETPLRFARRIDQLHMVPVPILPLWRMMALSNYSPRQPGEEQAARAKEVFDSLLKSQSILVKMRFHLATAFSRHCYTCLTTRIAHEKATSQTNLSATKLPLCKNTKPSGDRKVTSRNRGRSKTKSAGGVARKSRHISSFKKPRKSTRSPKRK